jgi:transposase
MKNVNTVAANKRRNFSEQKLTIGFDLGDRSSWYCVLDEAGRVLLAQKVSTTPKAMQEVFGQRSNPRTVRTRAAPATSRKLVSGSEGQPPKDSPILPHCRRLVQDAKLNVDALSKRSLA